MKRIDTLVRPPFWDQARAVLGTLGGDVTVRQVKTFGRVPTRREVCRGSACCSLDVFPELELTVLVDDALLESTLAALESIDREAKIVISSVESISRAGKRSASATEPAPGAAMSLRSATMPLQVSTTHA